MDEAEVIRNSIRGKGLDMDEAAKKLGMSRTTLYNKLNAKVLEKEFLQLVQERLGINVDAPERNSQTVAIAEKQVGNTTMKYHTVPLKEKRIIEMWMPVDFGKQDVKSLRDWLVYFESTL